MHEKNNDEDYVLTIESETELDAFFVGNNLFYKRDECSHAQKTYILPSTSLDVYVPFILFVVASLKILHFEIPMLLPWIPMLLTLKFIYIQSHLFNRLQWKKHSNPIDF